MEAHMRPVRRRLFIHAGGFDPVEPERLDHRLVSGLKRFAALWSIQATASKPALSPDGRIMDWTVDASGPNWASETRYKVLRWDDRIALYTQKPRWKKVVDGFAALLHFTFNGTILRYFSANPRYGMFVLYPFLLMALFAALAIHVGNRLADLDVPFAAALGLLGGIAVFALLLRFVGNYFHLYFALADWAFAAEFSQGRAAGFDQCLDQFADEIVASIRSGDHDEAVLSGVSLGGVVMAEAIARALHREPALFARGNVSFLTIGSSILKIGLHPEAESLKKAVKRVSEEASLFWIEYQSKVDPINFFQTDPVAMMGLPHTGRPIIRTMRIRETLTPEEYRYLKVNFLRLHRQFAMPNTRRYHYDFFLMCFGPMSLRARVALGVDAVKGLAEDGSVREVAAARGKNAR